MSYKCKILTANPTDDIRREQMNELFGRIITYSDDAMEGVVAGQYVRNTPFNEFGLYILENDQDLVAALYSGGAYKTASHVAETVGPKSPMIPAMIQNLMVIDAIAVDEKHRRQQLGTRLLRRTLGVALTTNQIGAQFLSFNNTDPGLIGFYEKNGFTVLTGNDLYMQFAGLDTGYVAPQDHPDYRWAVRDVNPGIVRLSDAPHPSVQAKILK